MFIEKLKDERLLLAGFRHDDLSRTNLPDKPQCGNNFYYWKACPISIPASIVRNFQALFLRSVPYKNLNDNKRYRFRSPCPDNAPGEIPDSTEDNNPYTIR